MPISVAALNGQSSSKKGTFDEKRYTFRQDTHLHIKAPVIELDCVSSYTGVIGNCLTFKRLQAYKRRIRTLQKREECLGFDKILYFKALQLPSLEF
jgi:hypothetical protein